MYELADVAERVRNVADVRGAAHLLRLADAQHEVPHQPLGRDEMLVRLHEPTKPKASEPSAVPLCCMCRGEVESLCDVPWPQCDLVLDVGLDDRLQHMLAYLHVVIDRNLQFYGQMANWPSKAISTIVID